MADVIVPLATAPRARLRRPDAETATTSSVI